METINYQGQWIEVADVSEFDGCIELRPNKYVEGIESLHRTEAGEYYLYRRLNRLDMFASNERQASGAELVHRLSLTGAALWAASRMTTIQTMDLRRDLNAALKAPTALDEHASHLLREYAASRGVDARDALNGAVEMALSNGGLADDEAVAAAKERRLVKPHGRTVRLAPTDACEPDPHPFATLVRETTGPDDNGTRRFVFTHAPREKKPGRRFTVEVTAKQWQEIEALAAYFKMRAPFFLRSLTVDELSGQPTFRRRKRAPLEKRLKAKHVMFACSDEALHRRIERVTQAREMSWDEYVADALGRDADSYEANMIVHPRTGDLLRADRDDLWTEMEEDVRFQDRAPLPLKRDKMSQAADRPDVALCAAALPTGDGDEEDEEPSVNGKERAGDE